MAMHYAATRYILNFLLLTFLVCQQMNTNEEQINIKLKTLR